MGTGNRRFNSSAFASVGSTVCKYGWATQYGCGSVSDRWTAYYYVVPGGHPSLVYRAGPLARIQNHITSGGDSGGPWFLGNSGRGVHGGEILGQSAFSHLPYALQRLGVTLLY